MRFHRLAAGVLMLGLLSLPAVEVARAASPAATAKPSVLPWIEDDLGRASAEGKERRLPVFVESWAPW